MFVARFPIFSDTDQTQVEMILSEAATKVDQSWEEDDYQPAIMYLAAHLIATDNSGEGESVEIGSSGGAAGVSSESFGGMSISYATGGSGSGSDAAAYGSSWGSTVYGRRFYKLLKLNKPAIVSV